MDLFEAIEKGDAGSVRRLVAEDPNCVRVKDGQGGSAIYRASAKGLTEVVECLIASGADVNAGTSNGTSPLEVAAYKDFPKIVALLIRAGADLSHRRSVMSPLEEAIGSQHMEVAQLLLEAGVPFDFKGRAGYSALSSAASAKNLDVTKFLLARGADPNLADDERWPPLHAAISDGAQLELVESLVGAGADVNKRDPNGETALYLAAQSGRADMVPFLVSHGARHDLKDKHGQTPLMRAAAMGNAAVVKALIVAGASTTDRDVSGADCLELFRRYNHRGTEIPKLIESSRQRGGSADDPQGAPPTQERTQAGKRRWFQWLRG